MLRHLYAYYYRDVPEICYWRDAASDREVDIIVRSPSYLLPFEIKYKESPDLDPGSGLAVYCAAEGAKQAYLVTKRESDFGVTELFGIDTKFLNDPARVLCFLLGWAEKLLWQ